ncbi:MAG: response regulator [Planctomycetes bacterium]|nr:response regulator [Planctomycetota bacterium]
MMPLGEEIPRDSIDLLPQPVALVRNGKIVHLNGAACQLLGGPAGPLVGARLAGFLRSGRLPAPIAPRTPPVQDVLERPDGTSIPVEIETTELRAREDILLRVFLKPAGATSHPAAAAPRPAPTILLVEDDALVREVMARALRGRGYIVLEAENGRDAIDLSLEAGASIDLLVTDVVMPRKGGAELAHELRARLPGLRVLFVSGFTRGALGAGDLRQPRTAFLRKPFTPSELRQQLDELLSR